MSDERRQAIFGPMRPPFLVLVPVCVLLGVATARWDGAALNWLHLLLAFVGALGTHIAVNALNEYDDFRSGLDLRTQRTPFSGGSGALPAQPARAHYALTTGIVALLVTFGVGVYFLLTWGWGIVPLGLLGAFVIVSYTRYLTRSAVLCLIAPGLGFGPLMVMGTHFALTGSYSWTAFVASLVPFFLVSNLLLLNQFPDLEADRSAGRRHLIIVHGLRAGVAVYGLFLAGAFLAVIAGFATRVLPAWSLLALLAAVLAVPTFLGARRHAGEVPALIPYLGRNVVINLLMPTLLAVGLFLSL
jgi:1,4-dihydroxy-2-naphthoate octaprenyltransferase